MTKLYDVPRNTRIRILEDDSNVPPAAPSFTKGEVIMFNHADGMYSHCVKDDGTVCHLAVWTEVEVVNE